VKYESSAASRRQPAAAGGRCWICEDEDVRPWKHGSPRALTPDDFLVTDSRYGVTLELGRCERCGFIFAGASDGTELLALYSQVHDERYEQSSDARVLQMERLLESALRLRPNAKSLLDIGAGTGLLVTTALGRGLDAVGVEPSLAAVEFGCARTGSHCMLAGTFPHPELAHRRYDLIFLVDVIEHVCAPIQLLEESRKALNPDGMIVVVTPDIKSIAARLLGNRWWHFRIAHVGYFSADTFGLAARRAALEVERAERANWFFAVGYLAARLEQYFPVHRLNALARSSPLLQRLYRRVVPLNLFDSWVFFLRCPPGETAGEHRSSEP
jgi:SAM-dependent methyltransferase